MINGLADSTGWIAGGVGDGAQIALWVLGGGFLAGAWAWSLRLACRRGERLARARGPHLLDNLDEALVVTGGDGRVAYRNRAAARLLAHLAPTAGSEPSLDGFWEKALPLRPARTTDGLVVERRLIEGGSLDQGVCLLAIRQSLPPGAFTLDPAEAGNAAGLSGLTLWTLLDVSHWRRLDQTVTEREARLSAVLNAIDESIMRIEPDGRIGFINTAGTVILGVARDQVIGQPLAAFSPPAVAWVRQTRVREVIDGGKAVRFVDRSGDRWREHTFSPIPDGEGRTVAIAACSRDVTAEKRVHQELCRREQFIRLITDNLPGVVFYVDEADTFKFVNRRVTDWLGKPPTDLLGRPFREGVDPLLNEATLAGRKAALAGERVDFDSEFVDPDGHTRRFQATFIPHLEGGEVLGYVGLLLDTTKRVEVEAAVRDALARAEAASTSKSRFLAAASHDLRQPMQALNIYVGLLTRQVREQPRAYELVQRVGQSVNALGDLLDSLLDVSKLDAGIVTAAPQPFAVNNILERMDTEMRPLFEAKGLRFRVVKSALMACSDDTLVERILRNLVTNAYRYTQSGGVVLGCRRRGGTVVFQVWDSGIGIPADRLDLIFEEFYQVGNQGRDRAQGLGLGLAIVRRLSQLLGHPVAVRSEVGRGTMFEVALPQASPEEMEAAVTSWTATGLPAIRDGTLAVVIDDDSAVLDGMALLLEDWGFDVVAAQDMLEAFEALRGSPKAPAVIIADYRLQAGGTGVAAVQSLRQAFGVTIPGVIVTGDTSPERLREVTASGFRLLHKPVRTFDLRAALAEEMGEDALEGIPPQRRGA
ncbi:PAS domain-containing protein [Rhodospirillum rubrum]|uniref:PAS domain-containing protein n=1 Tax=Rhodospirillum rubrum TaxID=1085 RepID=UPI0028AADF24|nr:PAS domain-containing protein [Rhodospirillum rubrum]